jgi:hypothetical protein
MPFSATVLNVLIASPSDVPAEREAIAQSLHEWNALHAETTGMVLLPAMWESHSAPSMADRPQGLINELVVRRCDMLIGAFWMRLGSPTGVEQSGTVEEINWFLKHKKPVMLYFSKAPIDPDAIDVDQLGKLKEFKESIRERGIQEQYVSVDDLKTKLSRQLTIVMRGMSVAPVINAAVVKEANRSTLSAGEQAPEEDRSPLSAQGRSEPIRLVDYTDRAFVVKGNSTAHAAELRTLGGKWIKLRTGGFGWMFSKRHVDKVSSALRLPAVIEDE